MEKRNPEIDNNYSNRKFKLNLKHLPPIDPCSIAPARNQQQVKYEIPSCRTGKQIIPTEGERKIGDVDSLLVCSTKHLDPNSIRSCNDSEISVCKNDPKIEGKVAPIKGSAKSKLLEICAANHWKPPLFECFNEKGPRCHMRMFIFKVTFEIESSDTILECFGAPQSKKKAAAEHASEGALWYLEHLGYFPIRKRKNY